MGDSESEHSFSGRFKVVECFQADVTQQTQMVIVTVFVPVVFPDVAREVFLVVSGHTMERERVRLF